MGFRDTNNRGTQSRGELQDSEKETEFPASAQPRWVGVYFCALRSASGKASDYARQNTCLGMCNIKHECQPRIGSRSRFDYEETELAS
jgi:hypothetical protein